VGQIWVFGAILGELLGVIGDKPEAGSIWLKNLAATRAVFDSPGKPFNSVADPDKCFIGAKANELPWNAARFRMSFGLQY
jgi:hypothetical protein